MSESRHHLFTTHRAADAMAEIDRLNALLKATFKKETAAELYFSSWGQVPNARYGITVYSDGKPEQVEFLKNAVMESALT